jgi:membrane protein implicated in regulation of membrane protease activity
VAVLALLAYPRHAFDAQGYVPPDPNAWRNYAPWEWKAAVLLFVLAMIALVIAYRRARREVRMQEDELDRSPGLPRVNLPRRRGRARRAAP